jgi:hypothetical protein
MATMATRLSSALRLAAATATAIAISVAPIITSTPAHPVPSLMGPLEERERAAWQEGDDCACASRFPMTAVPSPPPLCAEGAGKHAEGAPVALCIGA